MSKIIEIVKKDAYLKIILTLILIALIWISLSSYLAPMKVKIEKVKISTLKEKIKGTWPEDIEVVPVYVMNDSLNISGTVDVSNLYEISP